MASQSNPQKVNAIMLNGFPFIHIPFHQHYLVYCPLEIQRKKTPFYLFNYFLFTILKQNKLIKWIIKITKNTHTYTIQSHNKMPFIFHYISICIYFQFSFIPKKKCFHRQFSFNCTTNHWIWKLQNISKAMYSIL